MATINELMDTVERLKESLDGVYAERNLLIALVAKLSLQMGYTVGIGKDNDPDIGPEWKNIIYVEIPHYGRTEQLSWHLHQNEMINFKNVPLYSRIWDGHSTEEKYRRIENYVREKEG
jgi:hypothetical protein